MRDDLLSIALEWGLNATGVAFAAMCLWGVIGFVPSIRQLRPPRSAAVWLALAITLGFATNGVSAAIMFFAEPLMGTSTKLSMGLNAALRIAATVAVYLHFVARHKALSVEDQKLWTPLLMPFYPDREHVLYRVFFRTYK
ncbi:membrane protein [Rhodobacter phage RcDurkin]|nr:membrane protein [Rhodobacter phage RcDurkin]QXN72523.1 membrane protein [Rhodobacter phage RcTiptonus]UUV43797.1 membrane protein [Rhodobacter phage RcKickapoo]